ncbi:site-2 protease family protein [Symbiobacterium thermophilum]|uniref:Site-2 protease family protein n=1 Tax=Symbiobacterium thermophilum TaxID=2734 RepID=A0A953LHD0_SYMTR|nr:site-2 protease family protein [Symbiobacterium thermophilum]MBY6277133.1 site-2 protease family protein [Symbiobacterium thermophilum]
MALPSLQQIVMLIPGVVMGFSFHEFGHALVATWFGDDTPRLQGRLTLNPLAHLDPVGTLLLLLGGIGWARPVMVNPSRLRPRVLGDIAVSLAGVAMNFLLALVFVVLFVLAETGRLGWQHPVLSETLYLVVMVNVFLVGFNLLPIPPLDGFRVLAYAFPPGAQHLVETFYRFGPLLLILLFVTDLIDLSPVYNGIFNAVVWVASPLLRLL